MAEQDQTLARLTRELVRKEPERARELLDALPLSDRAALVMNHHGRERLDLILISEHTRDLVQALPAPEFWITIKEVGEEDAVELLRLAAPAQLQHVADLEWWHQGALDPLPAAYWLMLMTEAGSGAAVAWFNNADEELLVALLARFLSVHKPDPDDEGREPWRNLPNLWTLDDAYFLSFHDPNAAAILGRFLSFVRAEEPMKYYGLLDAVEMSLAIEQEEAARGFRDARLADYGFVDFDEALTIYAPLSDRELRGMMERRFGPAGAAIPRFPLALRDLPPLLAAALRSVTDGAALEEITMGLAALVSRVLVADGMDLSKLENLSAAVAKANAFVEMGLARASGGDPERAARALVAVHPFALFRAGYTRVVEIARAADQLLRADWPSRVFARHAAARRAFLAEDGLLLEGLLRPRPQYHGGAGERGAPVFREFRDGEEVARAARAVARVQALGLLFFEVMKAGETELLGLMDYRVGGEVSWRMALATAAAQAFSGNEFRFAPLSLPDARAALEAMLTAQKPRSPRADVTAALQSRVEAGMRRLAGASEDDLTMARELVAEALAKMAEEAKDLDWAALDARYFSSLIIARD